MRIKKIGKFQEGGEMNAPVEEGAPMQGAPAPGQGGEDPLMRILQIAQQALQEQNCEAAMAVCQALLQLAQGSGAPQEAPAEEPTYARRGAKLVRVR